MKTTADIRRALARLHRSLEKARREVRGLRDALEVSEADGFPGDDYAELDGHIASAVDLVKREQTRQQAKVLRSGGIAPGRLGGMSKGWDGRRGTSPTIWSDNE